MNLESCLHMHFSLVHGGHWGMSLELYEHFYFLFLILATFLVTKLLGSVAIKLINFIAMILLFVVFVMVFITPNKPLIEATI